MKRKHKDLWMWGGIAAAVAGVTYLVTHKAPTGANAGTGTRLVPNPFGPGLIQAPATPSDDAVKRANIKFHTPTGYYLAVANNPDGTIRAQNLATGAIETIDPGNTTMKYD